MLLGYSGSISGLRPFAAAMQVMALRAVLLREISDVKSRDLCGGSKPVQGRSHAKVGLTAEAGQYGFAFME